jgi:hypothetical protein
MSVKPNDLSEGSMFQITVEDGVWVADFFPDKHSRLYTGSGTGKTVEDAMREALDEAGE